MHGTMAVLKHRPSGVSPVGRVAQPNDVVDVIMFPLSGTARDVTATTFPAAFGTLAALIPSGSNQ